MSTALVVDDSATDREIIASCLKTKGINVLTARTGEEGLTTATNQKPDIIFLDVVLPGASGFEICREIKNQSATSKIPVIICSTKGSEMDKFWGMKQGADAYLSKPINQDEVLQAMSNFIKS